MRKLTAMAAILLLAPFPARAQEAAPPAEPSASPGWAARCASAGRTAPADCALEQRLVVQETGQPFLTVTVRVPAEPRAPFLLIQTPLGLHLPSGLTLKVDAGAGSTLMFEHCDPNGCYAGRPLDDGLLTAMRTGQDLHLTLRTMDGQNLDLDIPLAGFAKAYAGIQ